MNSDSPNPAFVIHLHPFGHFLFCSHTHIQIFFCILASLQSFISLESQHEAEHCNSFVYVPAYIYFSLQMSFLDKHCFCNKLSGVYFNWVGRFLLDLLLEGVSLGEGLRGKYLSYLTFVIEVFLCGPSSQGRNPCRQAGKASILLELLIFLTKRLLGSICIRYLS